MNNEILIQNVNLKIIKIFLNQLETKIWFKKYEIKNPNENLNLIWNIMYLYNSDYLISSFIDEEVPVIYNSSTHHPNFFESSMSLGTTKFYDKSTAELDTTSLNIMKKYSQTRKYVKGYYCKYNKGKLENFYYYFPLLTKNGIALKDLLNESTKKKRNQKIEKWIKAGADVIKVIAPLISMILSFR